MLSILAVIGTIDNPTWEYGNLCRATNLISNIITLLTVGAGIYTLVNLVVAGIGFIGSSGNPEKVQQAWAKIYQSLIGISVIIIALALTGVLGWLLFGNAGAILEPTITGPSGSTYNPCT